MTKEQKAVRVNAIANVGWWFNREVIYATLNETGFNTQIKWFRSLGTTGIAAGFTTHG